MDKYRRVKKPRSDAVIQENEIRITTKGKMRSYITYATNLLQVRRLLLCLLPAAMLLGAHGIRAALQTGKATEANLRAMGRAINKAITIAEIVKRRVPGLHQVRSPSSWCCWCCWCCC